MGMARVYKYRRGGRTRPYALQSANKKNVFFIKHTHTTVSVESTNHTTMAILCNAPINIIPHLPPPGRSGGNGGDLTF